MKKLFKNFIFRLWRRNPKLISKPENIFSGSEKILFLRHDRIGDLLISTPVFRAIREKYPEIEIHILLSKYNRQAFGMCSEFLDRSFVLKKRIFSFIGIIQTIRKQQYDLVIDLTDNASTTSTILLGFSKAKNTLGFNKENRSVYNYIVNSPQRSEVHIARRLLMLLLPFNIDINKIDHTPKIKISERIIAEQRSKYNVSKKSIGIVISGSNDSKFWGFDNINDLLIELVHRTDENILIYQTPQYPNVSENFIENKQIIYLKPGKSIEEFAALVSLSSLIITPDTAAIHIASALGIPQVAMFKVINKEKYGIPWYPINVDYELFEDAEDIRNIEPIRVSKSALKLLGK